MVRSPRAVPGVPAKPTRTARTFPVADIRHVRRMSEKDVRELLQVPQRKLEEENRQAAEVMARGGTVEDVVKLFAPPSPSTKSAMRRRIRRTGLAKSPRGRKARLSKHGSARLLRWITTAATQNSAVTKEQARHQAFLLAADEAYEAFCMAWLADENTERKKKHNRKEQGKRSDKRTAYVGLKEDNLPYDVVDARDAAWLARIAEEARRLPPR